MKPQVQCLGISVFALGSRAFEFKVSDASQRHSRPRVSSLASGFRALKFLVKGFRVPGVQRRVLRAKHPGFCISTSRWKITPQGAHSQR